MGSNKGQIVITDLFIAVAVFVILMTIITVTWNLYSIRLEITFSYDDMVVRGFQISDSLVKSPGNPEDWEKNASGVNQIGLANDDHILSQEKVSAFLGMSNEDIKNALNVNLYDFYFVIREAEGTVLISKGNIPSGKYTVNLARIVQYADKTRVMEIALWK